MEINVLELYLLIFLQKYVYCSLVVEATGGWLNVQRKHPPTHKHTYTMNLIFGARKSMKIVIW